MVAVRAIRVARNGSRGRTKAPLSGSRRDVLSSISGQPSPHENTAAPSDQPKGGSIELQVIDLFAAAFLPARAIPVNQTVPGSGSGPSRQQGVHRNLSAGYWSRRMLASCIKRFRDRAGVIVYRSAARGAVIPVPPKLHQAWHAALRRRPAGRNPARHQRYPRGVRAAGAARGRPAADRQGRVRPDGAGSAPGPHRPDQQAAALPATGPHSRVPDRRLHGADRRSRRAGTPPGRP